MHQYIYIYINKHQQNTQSTKDMNKTTKYEHKHKQEN